MRLVRYLQHWLGGTGPRLHVADCVPETLPIRQWADTFPWATLVAAVERSFAGVFPTLPAWPPAYSPPGVVSSGVAQARTGVFG